MPNRIFIADNENGFVLVAVMLMLLILAFIGITSSTTSNIELQIAGNDKVYKQTFYEADSGAAIIGSHLVEENMACWRINNGFTNNVAVDTVDTPPVLAGSSIINGQIVVERTSAIDMTPKRFWTDLTNPTTVSDTNRDAYYPQNYGSGPHTNIRIGASSTKPKPGYDMKALSNYDDAIQSTYSITYTIISQTIGRQNSISEVEINWEHTYGLEGDCNY